MSFHLPDFPGLVSSVTACRFLCVNSLVDMAHPFPFDDSSGENKKTDAIPDSLYSPRGCIIWGSWDFPILWIRTLFPEMERKTSHRFIHRYWNSWQCEFPCWIPYPGWFCHFMLVCTIPTWPQYMGAGVDCFLCHILLHLVDRRQWSLGNFSVRMFDFPYIGYIYLSKRIEKS